MTKIKIEDIVYLKTDPDQLPRQIVKYEVSKTGKVYALGFAGSNSWHFDFEFTKEKPTSSNKPGFGNNKG